MKINSCSVVKNLFPTSALHLHLKLTVVHLDPLKEDKSKKCSTTHYTCTEYKTTFGTEKKKNAFNCTSVNKFKASIVTDFAC